MRKPILAFFSFFLSLVYGQVLTGSEDTLTDKSHVFFSNGAYYQICPKDYGEIQSAIQFARNNHLKIKVRGKGHSANGSSVPAKNDIILLTDSLNRMIIWNDTMVSVESGVVMADCKQYLNANGYDLITCNEGGKGPTLGGYMAAGGIGASNEPGFWNTVEQVFMINGKGQQITIKKTDPNFKWLFGSMGQLGVVYKAYLRIKKLQGPPKNSDVNTKTNQEYNFCWFPIMVPANEMKEYSNKLQLLEAAIKNRYTDKIPNDIMFLNQVTIYVQHDGVRPPLVYKYGNDFNIIGIRILIKKSLADYKKVITGIRKIIDKALNNSVSSYFQVSYYEPNIKNVKKLLGQKTYDEFYQIKKEFDPEFIFGQKIFVSK